jgi:DNA-binding NarL/FixJ family response regulator
VNEPGYSKGAQANRAAAMRRDKGILARLESGWSYADIAKELNVNVDSVRTIVARARKRAGISVRPYVDLPSTRGEEGKL